jgi:hypothetical protein
MDQSTTFECRCGARYRVVRVEVPLAPDDPDLVCLSCKTPLHAREGKHALKYFRVRRSRPAAQIRQGEQHPPLQM